MFQFEIVFAQLDKTKSNYYSQLKNLTDKLESKSNREGYVFHSLVPLENDKFILILKEKTDDDKFPRMTINLAKELEDVS